MNTRIPILMALGLGAMLSAEAAPQAFWHGSAVPTSGQIRLGTGINSEQSDLYSSMRKLWEDHVAWTRMYIVSAANDLDNKDETTSRLLQNQIDIGNAIKPIYGDEAGRKLSALLKDHILIAADLITAAKKRHSDGVADLKLKWSENGDQIADFLSTANPRNWSRGEMRGMMRDHLELTLAEAVDEIKGDYAASVRKYDQIHVQILKMADMLSQGIVNQFPDRFASYSVFESPKDSLIFQNDPQRDYGTTAMSMEAGTVLPFKLNQKLSSNGSSVGDRFTANLETGDNVSYQGMAAGAILEGHVDSARAKSGDTPGVLGLAFDRVRMPDGQTYKVYGSLIGLDSKSVTNENGRLVAKSGAKKDNLKYVGYGAGAGALVSILTKGNILTNTVIGGALGYLYGEIQKNPSQVRDVTAEAGTRFGMRLTRNLSFQSGYRKIE